MSNDVRCTYRKDDGERCSVDFGICGEPGCQRCYSHCPHRERERHEARQRGGEASARKAKGSGALFEELPRLTSHEAAEIWCDVIGRYGAAEIISSAAANAGIRAVNEWRQCHEAGALSDRMEKLTAAVEASRKSGDLTPLLEVVEGGRR